MDGHDHEAPRLKHQAPNVVWRADIAMQRVVRDSSTQAAPVLRSVARAANWWGGTGVVLFAAVLWLGARAFKRRTLAQVGLRGAEGLAVASALSAIIKGLTGRARPFVTPGEPWHWEFNRGWVEAQFFSMPSGHTTATMAFAVAVTIATIEWKRTWRLALAGPLLASALVVAFARMYADQHWLTDVIAAAALGAVTSLILARVHAKAEHPGYARVMLGEPVQEAANSVGAAP
jgi:membrane-associated phospholipid phosphatase